MHTDTNERSKQISDDFEEKIKEKINFQNILNKNFKKNANTPVSDLIKSTTQMVVEEEYLAPKIQNHLLIEKIDRLEALVQSIIINQKNATQAISYEIPSNKADRKNLIPLFVLSILISIGATYGLTRNKETMPEAIVDTKIKSSSSYAVTLKFTNLRVDPSTKSRINSVIQPNTKLKVIKDHKDWVNVEYQDYLKNKLQTGWIFADNLKQL